jgi:putative addiction module component (TIGR02574 family)
MRRSPALIRSSTVGLRRLALSLSRPLPPSQQNYITTDESEGSRAAKSPRGTWDSTSILTSMNNAENKSKALQLPVEDRLELAEAIWESLEREPAQLELPSWQREILDERLAADDAAPETGSPWEEVKRRILAKL